MTTIPTMTANELRQRLKEIGIPMSHDTMAAAIEQGLFPFAHSFRVPGSKKRRYLIYSAEFDAWCAERQENKEDL